MTIDPQFWMQHARRPCRCRPRPRAMAAMSIESMAKVMSVNSIAIKRFARNRHFWKRVACTGFVMLAGKIFDRHPKQVNAADELDDGPAEQISSQADCDHADEECADQAIGKSPHSFGFFDPQRKGRQETIGVVEGENAFEHDEDRDGCQVAG